MSKKIFMFGMICLLGTLFVVAATVDVSGDWQLITKTKKTEKTAIFNFVQDGEKLTVTMKRETGKGLKGDGTIKENNIQWTMARKNKKGTVIFTYTGVVNGDAMKGELVVERNGEKKSPLHWNGTRQK